MTRLSGEWDLPHRDPFDRMPAAQEIGLFTTPSMITSEKNPAWSLDTQIGSIEKAGLSFPSKVRMKIFTLDSRLILRKIGGLSAKDQKAVKENLHRLLSLQ